MIAHSMKDSIDRYVDIGCPAGDFLCAVLSNDLFEACAHADEYNSISLASICNYIYNYTPSICWGSLQAYTDWINLHRTEAEKAQMLATADRKARQSFYN